MPYNQQFVDTFKTDAGKDVFAEAQNDFQHGELEGYEDDEYAEYEMPDPSRKQNISQDTPIVVNQQGQYNLNFIDWTNEYEEVLDRYTENYHESPIDGMDIHTFEGLYE